MASATPQARMHAEGEHAGGERIRVAHLEAAVSASSDGMLCVDRDGRVLSWNTTARRVLAPAGPLVVGMRLADAFVDASLFTELLGRAFDGEIVDARHMDVAGGDGRPGPVQLTLVPIHAADPDARAHDGDGPAPPRVECTVVLKDLHEEASSQEALAEGERKVRRAEALAMTGTFVLDAHDDSMQWSEGMYRIHALDPADFVPSLSSHLDRVVPADREAVAELLDQALAGAATTGLDHRVVRGDQSESWLHLAVEPRTGPAGEVLGLSGVCQDVNARVAMVEELRRVDAVKDEFLATAAHELRTPLTSIVGFTELLTQLEPDQESLIAPIERNALEMRRLVEGLLDQARLESGKVTIERTRFELRPAAQAMLDELSPAQPNVRLEIPENLEIEMDAEAFSRVLGNLVGNAIKYAGDGSITISAQRVQGSPEELISVSVADEGPGIALEDQEHLFDPFFRAPAASRTVRGSGFGLAIVRRYLELHGGDIICRSTPGHGATFTFRLPIGSEQPT